MTGTLSAPIGRRLAVEYASARARMRALLTALDDDGVRRMVPACPQWTVAELAAHVTGLSVGYTSGGAPPGDRQAWLLSLVTERRGRPLAEILDEWDIAGPRLEVALARDPNARWPLVYDVIAHEHDLRGAIGQPGHRDGDAVQLGLELGLRIAANDLARHDLPGIRVLASGVERTAGRPPVELTISATTFEAFRLLGSRRTAAEMRAASTGDLDRFLPGIVHMQLPTDTLGESPTSEEGTRR